MRPAPAEPARHRLAAGLAVAFCRMRCRPIAGARGWVGWPSMKFRKLGDSDMEVSEISLGSWLTYGAGVEREHTQAPPRAALEAGINFFDTANVYGAGAAPRVWGAVPRD